MQEEQTLREPPPLHPARMPLMRPHKGRILCGVCKGVSLHLGIPVFWIRLVMVLMAPKLITCVIYCFLWLTLPQGDPTQAVQPNDPKSAPLAPSILTEQPDQKEDHSISPGRITRLLAGLGIILLLTAVFLLNSGMRPAFVVPCLLFCAGLVLAWLKPENQGTGYHLPTLIGSLALILSAAVIFLLSTQELHWALTLIVLAGLLLIGVTAVVVPWVGSILSQLGDERAMKEREEERADMAAHLHDGVLQTLALIQLHADDPHTVFTLARSQERDLRNWLYQERTPSDRSVSTGLSQIAAQVEDDSGKPIEVVTVGDAMPCAQTDALLNAARQALVNAVTHGGEPISVYCEARRNQVEVYVRDHGSGFDMDAIPADRLGIRESIIGRIRRRGGRVEIVSRPGWGTEVRMHMPLSEASQHQEGKVGQAEKGTDAQQ